MAVELALLAPVLLMLIFGVIEYSWFFVKSGQVTNAARHGARIAARPSSANTDITTDVATLMTEKGMGSSGYDLDISADNVDLVGIGESITVTISVPYNNISLGLPFVPTPTTVAAAVTMAKESP
ncbi:MAG: TadE/TadG family type IV pilus assembly protein [Planctomycetota bacterium]